MVPHKYLLVNCCNQSGITSSCILSTDMMVRPSPGELIFYPNEEFSRLSHISNVEEYLRLYQKSIEEPEEFWTEVAEEFYWTSWPNKELLSYNFDTTQGPVFIRWMDGAVTNMCYNVVDRVINKGLGDRVAYYWYVIFTIYTGIYNFVNLHPNLRLREPQPMRPHKRDLSLWGLSIESLSP